MFVSCVRASGRGEAAWAHEPLSLSTLVASASTCARTAAAAAVPHEVASVDFVACTMGFSMFGSR